MREIHFTPGDFEVGASYIAELLLNGVVVQSMTPLPNQSNTFVVTVSGSYVLRVRKIGDDSCGRSQFIDALFPVVTYQETDVDCTVNTYQYIITLTNPATAGSLVQYGWSLINQSTSVTNWTSNNVFTIQADSLPRYFFVRNNSGCSVGISSSTKNPCVTCSLTVTGITFTCG